MLGREQRLHVQKFSFYERKRAWREAPSGKMGIASVRRGQLEEQAVNGWMLCLDLGGFPGDQHEFPLL